VTAKSRTPSNIVVFGATGTAGSELVRQCLVDPRIDEVRAVVRRPLGFSHEKLREVACSNFEDLSAIRGQLLAVRACFFCLGISSRQAADEADYRRVTVGYALAAARFLRESSPEHGFHFLSGAGADRTGESWMMWARVKGEAENELGKLGLKRLFIYRPGYIHPDDAHARPGLVSAIGRWLFPVLRTALPRTTIRAVELARAMIEVEYSRRNGGLFENPALLELGRGAG
jgi:uncharacterized protein YbjT (DUF2867 family)